MAGIARPVDAEVAERSEAETVAPASFAPGPVSRLIGWVDALGWSGWLVYLGLALALLAWNHLLLWTSGRIAPQNFDPNAAIFVAYAPYALVLLSLGRRIAGRAVVTFWPATGWHERHRARWILAFVDAPARLEGTAIAIGLVIAVGTLLGSPASMIGTDAQRPISLLAYAPTFVAGYVLSAVFIASAVRWVLLVARIHRGADALDPFDTGPIHAFSRLTAFVAIAILFADWYTFTVNAGMQAGNVPALVFVVFVGVSSVLGFGAFIAPLWGIHERLVRIKDGLRLDVERRISKAGNEMYARIDAGAFDETKVISDSLTGLGALRDRVGELPTWPWQPELLRGFISAMLLPVIVFVVTRVISGQLGN